MNKRQERAYHQAFGALGAIARDGAGSLSPQSYAREALEEVERIWDESESELEHLRTDRDNAVRMSNAADAERVRLHEENKQLKTKVDRLVVLASGLIVSLRVHEAPVADGFDAVMGDILTTEETG